MAASLTGHKLSICYTVKSWCKIYDPRKIKPPRSMPCLNSSNETIFFKAQHLFYIGNVVDKNCLFLAAVLRHVF